jgi:hypothetical protein
MKVNRLEYRYRVDAFDVLRSRYRRIYRSASKSDAIAQSHRFREPRVIDQLTETRIR